MKQFLESHWGIEPRIQFYIYGGILLYMIYLASMFYPGSGPLS